MRRGLPHLAWWLWATVGWLTLPLDCIAAIIVCFLNRTGGRRVAIVIKLPTIRLINWYLAREPKI